MKILYVITTTDRGGAETALRACALAAQQAGHTVRIVSLKPLGTIGCQMQEEGLAVSSLDLQGKFDPVQTTGALARLIKEIQDFQADIVHGFLFRAIQLCRLAKRRVSFKLITTPHYNLARVAWWMRLIDRALKDADDISTAESETNKHFLLTKQKYKKEKVCLVSNGVDGDFFAVRPEEKEKHRKNNGFSEQDFIFCCVARLSKEKNQALLIQSFAALHAKHPSVRLLLVGEGSEREKLEQTARQYQVEKEVVFVGEVSDVREYLQISDVFVLASYIESLPLALLEACSCGLPAIVSKEGDMPQVVVHGETGFVFNGTDPLLLTVLMAELFENKDLRLQMGQKSRTRVREKYMRPEARFLQLYRDLK